MQQLEDMGLTFGMTTVDGRRTLHINGPSCVRWEAIGEAYNAEQMHRVVNWLHGRTDYSVDAWLVVETQVRAVALWVLGGKVGYLPHVARFVRRMLRLARAALAAELHSVCQPIPEGALDGPATKTSRPKVPKVAPSKIAARPVPVVGAAHAAGHVEMLVEAPKCRLLVECLDRSYEACPRVAPPSRLPRARHSSSFNARRARGAPLGAAVRSGPEFTRSPQPDVGRRFRFRYAILRSQ